MTAPTAPRSAPVRAVISHPALDGNARGLREAGASCADLRRDAWGHGLAACAVTVTAAGLRVRVDEEERAAVADLPDALVTTTAEPDADPRALWGLPGASQPVMSQPVMSRPVMSRPVMSRPVMSLRGSLLSTKLLRAGEGVSYGYTFRADDDMIIGLVCGGYAQGVVRAVGNHARVRVADGFARIIGRVAMDACVIALDQTDASAGDEVVFFGDPADHEPSLAEWTDETGLTPAEIVSLVGARAQRRDLR